MPLPLIIPVVLGGGALISLIWGGKKIGGGVSRINSSKRRYDSKKERLEARQAKLESEGRQTQQLLEELGRTRLEATASLGRAARFFQNAKVKDRNLLDRVGIPKETVEDWNRRTIDAVDVLTGVGKSAAAGTMTAVGIYGAAGYIGTASTGTAIATLSGAAATNASLAWLGGGALAAGGGGMALGTAVLGGLVAAPAVLVAGFFMEAKAEQVETEVERCCAQCDVAKEQMENHSAQLKVIAGWVEEVSENIQKVAQSVEKLVRTRHPEVHQDVYDVFVAATSLAGLIDTPVIQSK